MKTFTKALISAYILLTSISAVGFIYKTNKFQDFLGRKLSFSKINKSKISENNKKWANEILNGGYILLFRHAERDKWLDVGVYDAIESDLHENGLNKPRFGENEYFADAVCLNSKGKIQAKAMKEIIDYSKLPVGYVISSPICRSRQTADLAFGGYQKISRDLVYKGPFSDQNRDLKLKNLLLSLPIYDNTNTIITAHNMGSDCEVFAEKGCKLKIEEGGFYVLKKEGQNIKLVYEFNNFQDYSRVFFKR